MINWQPFSTAPKNRPFYAYSEREGIATLKWEEPPSFHMWEAAFKRKPNDPTDRGIISHGSIYPDSWSHWCEIDEIKPRLNVDQHHEIALRLNKIKSHARNYTTPTDIGNQFRAGRLSSERSNLHKNRAYLDDMRRG